MRSADSVATASSQLARGEVSRHAAFATLVIAAVAWFWAPLSTVISFSLQYSEYEHYSHIVAIPFMSLFLIYVDRRAVLARTAWAPLTGGLVIVVGLAAAGAARFPRFGREGMWAVAILSMVTVCIGAFVACYGRDAFRKAAYPLLLLILMAPMPPSLLQATITFLQRWSAEATAALFDVLGVPVYREGFRFALPGLTIEIAEECSGIRSSLALFVMSLVAGRLFLRKAWSRASLALVVIPLAIVKNAVRIVVLSLLAIHVDPAFITGSAFHRYSGMPVFAISFVILGGIIWILQRLEAKTENNRAIGIGG